MNIKIIIDFIKENNIICPAPARWDLLWVDIFNAHEEKWRDPKIRANCFPCVLGGSDADDKTKSSHFITSIKYFYGKYPCKRRLIEYFIFTNDRWHTETFEKLTEERR